MIGAAAPPDRLYVRVAGLFSEYLGKSEPVVDEQQWFSICDVAYINKRG